MSEPKQPIVLPVSVTELRNVRQLLRELEDVDEFLRQAALRKAGASINLPKTTDMLHEFAEVNRLNLLQPLDRAKLARLLENLSTGAPVVHISFASDPSSAFIAKILAWFREYVHPLLLLQIGLQPTIAAGCTLRTDSKYFDLSLRASLLQNRQLLIAALTKLGQQPVRPNPAAQQGTKA